MGVNGFFFFWFKIFGILGGIAWSGEYAIAEPMVVGHGGWVCLPVPELLSIQGQNEEQNRAGDCSLEAVWPGILSLSLGEKIMGYYYRLKYS